MKKLYLLVFFTFSVSFYLTSQTAYVNQSASGANDGSSWTDAYQSLETALQDSTVSALWIASGTYVPGGGSGDTASTFLVSLPMDIYGGFAGNEGNLSDRVPGQNPTVLNGDIAGNDDGSMDPALRSDNVRHVMVIESGLGRLINVDGLTFSGGQTSNNGDHDFFNRVGGGLFCQNNIHLSNCTFTNNYGRSGAGAAIENSGFIDEEVLVTNCFFRDNFSDSQSAGLIMYELQKVTVDNCEFTDNTTNRGVLYPFQCLDATVSNTLFENNTNPTGFGGAMFSWQTINLTLEDCVFRGNESVQSGCMYYDARNIAFNDPSLTIRGCTFQNNSATDGFSGAFTMWQGSNILIENCEFNRNTGNSAGCMLYNGTESPLMDPNNLILKNCEFGTNEALDFGGGACYFSGSSFTIDSCTFLGNIGANSGGAVFATGDNKEYIIKNSFFGLNNSVYGGALTNYGDNTNGLIQGCEFLNNNAGTGGGVMNCGFKANITVDDCMMRGSTASVGGAISAQNDSTTVTVKNSMIMQNASNGSGGGFFTFTGDLYVNLYNTVFTENTADFGAAIHLSGSTGLDTSYFDIDRCKIYSNTATTQGAGVNIINKSGIIQNTLIHDNIAEGVGTGGAISVNASGNVINVEVDILNSTLTRNLGILASGIAGWTEPDSQSTADIRVQNTILDNNNDFEIEDGTPQFISLGGNFSSDAFMDEYFMFSDLLSPDPMFVDPDFMDFHLLEGSLCIDAGIPTNSPSVDLDGATRDSNPDIGAYEFGASVSTKDLEIFETLNVYPNPVIDQLTIDLPGEVLDYNIKIFDQRGALIKSQRVSGSKLNIETTDYPQGEYFIFLQGEKNYKGQFIKIK